MPINCSLGCEDFFPPLEEAKILKRRDDAKKAGIEFIEPVRSCRRSED
jgi:hypothetical protein